MRITLSFKIMRRSLKIWFISAIGNFYSKSSYEFWKQGNNSWLQIQNILNEFNNQSDRRNATQENQWHIYLRSAVQHSFIQLHGLISSLINNTSHRALCDLRVKWKKLPKKKKHLLSGRDPSCLSSIVFFWSFSLSFSFLQLHLMSGCNPYWLKSRA